MRRRLWLAGVVLGLCGALPAWAQSANPWGGSVGPTINQPVDTSAWPSPVSTSPTSANPFRTLAGLFPSFGKGNKKPQVKARKKKPHKWAAQLLQ